VESPGSYPCGKRMMNIIVIYCDDLCGKMQTSKIQVDGTRFLLLVFHLLKQNVAQARQHRIVDDLQIINGNVAK
jgi:hypothetical protein